MKTKLKKAFGDFKEGTEVTVTPNRVGRIGSCYISFVGMTIVILYSHAHIYLEGFIDPNSEEAERICENSTFETGCMLSIAGNEIPMDKDPFSNDEWGFPSLLNL